MNGLAATLRERWHRFWFRPEPPEALCLCRILFFAMLLYEYGGADFTLCVRLGQIFWEPLSFYQVLNPQGPPPVEWIAWMSLVWKISLVLTCLGLWTRASSVAACLLGIYLIGLPYNFGKINHYTASASICLAVFAMSPCGRVYSLDRLIARWRGVPRLDEREVSGACRWPIQMMRVVISLFFFGAAVNKLRASGLAWVFSETMQMNLAQHPTLVGLWVAKYAGLCHVLAAVTICVELLHPLSLFSKWCALIWVPAGIAMLIGFKVMMDIFFLPLFFIHIFWLPWNLILPRLRAFMEGKSIDSRAGLQLQE